MNVCAIATGFLLPHPCGRASIGACSSCGKQVCETHASLADSGLKCRACETGNALPPLLAAVGGAALLAGTAPLFLAQDLEAFESAALADEPDDAFSDLS
ncbi:MAG: hypothetical protein AB7O37_18855 [Vicinamibacteria bacterium]